MGLLDRDPAELPQAPAGEASLIRVSQGRRAQRAANIGGREARKRVHDAERPVGGALRGVQKADRVAQVVLLPRRAVEGAAPPAIESFQCGSR